MENTNTAADDESSELCGTCDRTKDGAARETLATCGACFGCAEHCECAELGRANIAHDANEVAMSSRRPGAPSLSDESTREQLIAWLSWNDPNGSYTDEALAVEDYEPMTTEGAWEAISDVVEAAR